MSDHNDSHQESPKRVYFGIPIAFALVFWFVVFLCLKACDGPKSHCGKDAACGTEDCSKCSPECKAKCEAENADLKEGEKAGAGLEPANGVTKTPGKEGEPDSPNAVEGEKSPVEKSDSAKAH